MNKKLIVLMLLLPLLLMFTVFTSTNSVALNVAVAVSKIEIAGANIVYLDMDQEEKYFVNYSVYPVAATNKKVNFSTEQVGDEPLANLEFVDGYIVPKSAGSARVYLTTADGGFQAGFVVIVESKSLQSIECAVSNNELFVGDVVKIQTQFFPENAKNKMLIYETSNAGVATVNNKGEITATGKGQATITIKSEDNPMIQDTIVVTVRNKDVMDLVDREVYTWRTSGALSLSIDTNDDYELTYKVFDENRNLISPDDVFVNGQTGFCVGENGPEFIYCFKDEFMDTVIVELTITVDNDNIAPVTEECVIHRVDEITLAFDTENDLKVDLGSRLDLHNYLTLTPSNADVTYQVEFSNVDTYSSVVNDNLSVKTINQNGKIILDTHKAGVTVVTVKATNNEAPYQTVQVSKTIVVMPGTMEVEESGFQLGIEKSWTVGQFESDGSESTEKVHVSIGGDIGVGFADNVEYKTDNEDNVRVLEDGTVKILNSDFVGFVNISAKFKYGDFSKETTLPCNIRCVGDGVNVRHFNDLYIATNQQKPVVLQTEIKDNFGEDLQGNKIYTEESVTKIQSTYDTTYYKNLGEESVAKVKVLINFKNDVYGNGYEINAHNVAYGLDETGTLKEDALFKGPLDFVSMNGKKSSAVKVKAQDNISFAVYENVKLNNVILSSCTLSSSEGQIDLTDLNYVGTTVEVFGDNVDIEYSRISNGRTVLRVFGDIEDNQKIINLNIKNSVLSNAREFIIRMGSNCFVDGNADNPTPFIDPADQVLFPVQKYYQGITATENDMSDEEKSAYDSKYIKTFVNMKNSILRDSGLFCVGIDAHFSGGMLANGKSFSSMLKDWHDLAKTSYGAKLTIEGDVRLYDWKNINSINSDTLIEIQGEDVSDFADLKFDINAMLDKISKDTENPYLQTIVHTDDSSGERYVHGGIAFFGGGKNYGVVEAKDNEFYAMNGYGIKLSDVGKELLQAAAGNESFYFLMYGSDPAVFLPQDQNDLLASGESVAYSPIYKNN